MDPRRELLKWSRSQERALQREAEYKVNAGKRRVAQVVHAVNLDHINVLRVEPVAGPRVPESEPIATVLEAVIAVVAFADMERVSSSKIGPEAIVGNAATAVTTGALFLLFRPSLLCVLLLCVLLFLLCTFFLLLCVFLFVLGVLVLLLSVFLFLLAVLLLLLCALLLLLGVLLLLRRRSFVLLCGLLGLRFFLFGFGFLFLLLVLLLGVHRSHGHEGQRQNCCADKSN